MQSADITLCIEALYDYMDIPTQRRRILGTIPNDYDAVEQANSVTEFKRIFTEWLTRRPLA